MLVNWDDCRLFWYFAISALECWLYNKHAESYGGMHKEWNTHGYFLWARVFKYLVLFISFSQRYWAIISCGYAQMLFVAAVVVVVVAIKLENCFLTAS